MRKRSFFILLLLFASGVINYLDRQSLSILAHPIQVELHLTDLDYSHIVQMFLLSYTLVFVVAGRITDWLRPRKAMAIFILVWSVADMCTSFVRTGTQLGVARLFLGFGEPGNWTAAPKAISETFDAKIRPVALAINTSSATIGAAIAAPLVSFLALRYSWHSAFVITGILGLLWIIPWVLIYPAAKEQPAMEPVAGRDTLRELQRWKKLAMEREVWLLAALRMCTDPVWFFYLFWFPKYLTDRRHLTLRQLGSIAWVVYVAADLGVLLAGTAVTRRIARGGGPVRSERWVMTILACIAPLGMLIPFVSHLTAVLMLACAVAFAQLAWQSLSLSLAVNYFPKDVIGTALGIAMAGSGLGGLLSTNLIGHVITSYSYAPVFYGLAIVHPLALLLLWRIRAARAASVSCAEQRAEAAG